MDTQDLEGLPSCQHPLGTAVGGAQRWDSRGLQVVLGGISRAGNGKGAQPLPAPCLALSSPCPERWKKGSRRPAPGSISIRRQPSAHAQAGTGSGHQDPSCTGTEAAPGSPALVPVARLGWAGRSGWLLTVSLPSSWNRTLFMGPDRLLGAQCYYDCRGWGRGRASPGTAGRGGTRCSVCLPTELAKSRLNPSSCAGTRVPGPDLPPPAQQPESLCSELGALGARW